ncbi:hypothetical protein Tco_1464975 [Tanacetum coccineum]
MVGSLMYLTARTINIVFVSEKTNAMSTNKLIQSGSCGMSRSRISTSNTMAEQNVPTQPPTRTDEQIVPRSQWLTIGKSNLLFNAQKIQKNPIFQISVDILSNTNFFQAFTASANVPAIYLQQFWNTMKYNEKTGVYSCQVDEQWFDLSADLLRKALAITPVNPTHPFELPPSGNTVIDFVNELGYPEPVEIVSNIRNLKENSDDTDLETAKKISLDEHQEMREGGGTDADLEKEIKLSLDPSFLPQGQPPVGGVAIRDPVSETIPKLPEVVGKGKAKHLTIRQLDPSSQPEDDTSEKVVQESSSTTDSERTEVKDTSAPKDEKETRDHSIPSPSAMMAGQDWRRESAVKKTDLIEKYSVLPGPESIKNQESKKSPKEIIIIKKEQGEEKQESTYSSGSTIKVALEEFDLKSALFKHMNKNKTANRNPANYHLYHALMEALIADEDAMDKEVKDMVKNHKRKHDSDDDEDDDDDKGPSDLDQKGKSAKRRRHVRASGVSLNLLQKMDRVKVREYTMEGHVQIWRTSKTSHSQGHGGLEMVKGWTRGGAKDLHHSNREKDYRSGGSLKSGNALLEKNKRY